MNSNHLTDQSLKPDEQLIISIIGEKYFWWQSILAHLYENYNDITEEWKYYNDGKCWLFRTLIKKKTVFWIAVVQDTFKLNFWFADKAAPVIVASNLAIRIKADFENANRTKIGRGISVVMTSPTDVEEVKKLIGIKLKIK
jgi:hypothetical protein